MMNIAEIKELIDKTAESILRCPDGWPSMERHDQPGTPRNLIFVSIYPFPPKELIEAMRASYKVSVRRIVEQVVGIRLE